MEILLYRPWEPAGYNKREYWKTQSKEGGMNDMDFWIKLNESWTIIKKALDKAWHVECEKEIDSNNPMSLT